MYPFKFLRYEENCYSSAIITLQKLTMVLSVILTPIKIISIILKRAREDQKQRGKNGIGYSRDICK